ncbi:MAG: proton-conducting transporter membrane subunit [Anaerolineales bacterium]
MNAPIILLGGAAVLAGGSALLHDQRRAASITAAIGSLVLAGFALLSPLDQPVAVFGANLKIDTTFQLLGRGLTLDASNRSVIGFLFVAAAFLFGGGWAARPNRYLYSAGTMGLGFVAASLMVRPFLYAAIFLELAAMAFVLVLADPQRPARIAAHRVLVFYTLAMMTVLISGWLLDTSGVTGGAPELVDQIGRFLGLGFAIIMLVPPFHLWLPPAASETDSYSLSYVVVILYSAGIFFLLRFFNNYEWLRVSPEAASAVRAAGILMIVVGSLSAIAQTELGRAGIFILLADLGASLTVVGLGTSQGYQLALGISGVRIVGLGLWALAFSMLRRVMPDQEREHVLGVAYSNPLIVVAMIVGLLSLSGAPLTAGFPGRWAAMQQLSAVSPIASLTLVAGVGISSAVALRWLQWTLSRPDLAPATIELGRMERILLLAAMGLSFGLGFFPQLIYPWIVQSIAGLSNLIG